jgi:hypothetical protein
MRTAAYVLGNTQKPIDDVLQAMQSITTGITAFAGGGQASATQLTAAINEVTVCATNADSVKLPLAVAGIDVFVSNLSGQTLQVIGAGTDTINAVATATGVAVPTLKSAHFVCTSSAPAGKWRMLLGA